MGFGGFFNYEQPGPGVKKDGPKKKTFFIFLEIWFRNIWKLCSVSLFYTICNLLILPSGLGSAGMTNVARNLALDKHSFGIYDFFQTIKKNWKQALPAGIINFLVTAILCYSIYFYFLGDDIWSVIGFGLSVALFICFSFLKYHIWLIIITFKLPLKKIYKNCFLFIFVNIKANIIIALTEILLTAGVVALFFIPYYIAWAFAILIAILIIPGFVSLLTQLLIFPKVKKLMIDPYYEEHPEEDIELRRGLGLSTENASAVYVDNIPDEKENIN